MKKATIMAFLLAALAPVMQVWASSNYYAYAKAVKGTGCGKVYASKDQTSSPAYVEGDHTSEKQGGSDKSKSYKFYLYAQGQHGYKFKTWESLSVTDDQSSNKGTADLSNATTEKGCLVTVTTGSKDFGNSSGTQNTTASVTATYEQCTEADLHYTLTMGNNPGTSAYTITGTVGFPSVAPGASATVWFNDVLSFSVTAVDGYDFVRWCVEDANGKSYPEGQTLSNLSFTSDTKISAEFKQQKVCKATCLVSEGGTYKANGNDVSGTDSVVNNHAEVSVTLSQPSANTGYEFYGWYKLHENGVKEYVSYYKDGSTTITERDDVTVGAEFRRKADINLNFQPAEGASYTVNSNKIVEDEAYDMPNQAVGSAGVSVTLAITSAIDKQPRWWYRADEMSEKTYFSYNKSVTRVFAESAIVGVDLVHSEKSLARLLEKREGDTVTLSDDAEVVYETTTTIPAGVTVDLGGHTLYIDGTLENKGTIQNGIVSKCTKLIRQTGNGLAPIVADNISYWDTRVENYTATATEASTTHLTIINGYGISIHGALQNSSPSAIVCNIDASSGAAINTIIGYVGDYTAIGGTGGAILSTGGNTKLVVQLQSSVSLGINDFPSGSGWRSTSNSQEQTKLGKGYRIDCAHNSIELKYEVTNASISYFINAESAKRTSGLQLGSTENFINCKELAQRINGSNASYAVKFNVYDCGNPSVTWDVSNTFTTDGCGVNFRSGGPYTVPSANNSNYHVFGGFYTSAPDSSRIVNSGYKFYQHADSYWYLEPTQDPNVATVDGVKKLYLSEAFEVAIADTEARSIITLLKDCTLPAAVIIPKDIKVRVDLAGCKITAPNGFVVNKGDLEIGDKYGNLSKSGVVSELGNVFVNEDGGKITIAYGKYTGGILLNAGSEFITHHGRFESPLTVGEGVLDKSGIAKLYGGIFATDVSEYLTGEYQQKSGYVGFSPYVDIDDDDVSGYEKAYHLEAFDDNDAQIFANQSLTAFTEDWYRRAELQSAVAPYTSYTIDAVLSFDRMVEAGSVTVYAANSLIGKPLTIDSGITAHTDHRIMSRLVASYNYYQISYSRFISDKDVNSITCAIKDNEEANRGTTCLIRMDLCSGAVKYDVSNLKTVYTIGMRRYVFGAVNNMAMLQTESGADFFATLADAVDSDATTEKTIKLCNDCAEDVTVGKVCTIDVNGFNFTGNITADEGLSVKKSNGVYLISAPDPADVYVEQVKVENVVSDDWKAENGLDADAAPEAVQEALKQEDGNELQKWENLVLGQDSATKPSIEASAGGTETTATIAVSFDVPKDAEGDAINTGYTVKYAFDKVDVTTGTVVEGGEGTAQETPSLGLESVTAEEGPSYFKMRAVLEASDNSSVTVDVPVEKTIGVMKVESNAEYTILAVPWKSLGDGNVTAAELVHAACLQNGDELIVYGDNGTFNKWTVKNGEWATENGYVLDEDEPVASETPAPSTVGLARGKGVWLKRNNPSESPIYLIGQPSDDPVQTPLAKAGEGDSSWNLVASPSSAPVNVATVLSTSGDAEDRVIVPMGANAAPKNFHRNKNGHWGYDSTEDVIRNGVRVGVRAVFKTAEEDTTIPAGTGFWYLNSSKEDGKTIQW